MVSLVAAAPAEAVVDAVLGLVQGGAKAHGERPAVAVEIRDGHGRLAVSPAFAAAVLAQFRFQQMLELRQRLQRHTGIGVFHCFRPYRWMKRGSFSSLIAASLRVTLLREGILPGQTEGSEDGIRLTPSPAVQKDAAAPSLSDAQAGMTIVVCRTAGEPASGRASHVRESREDAIEVLRCDVNHDSVSRELIEQLSLGREARVPPHPPWRGTYRTPLQRRNRPRSRDGACGRPLTPPPSPTSLSLFHNAALQRFTEVIARPPSFFLQTGLPLRFVNGLRPVRKGYNQQVLQGHVLTSACGRLGSSTLSSAIRQENSWPPWQARQ